MLLVAKDEKPGKKKKVIKVHSLGILNIYKRILWQPIKLTDEEISVWIKDQLTIPM